MIPSLFTGDADPFTQRVFSSYLYEAMALLGEAAAPAQIEQAAEMLGFPVGPLSVLDQLSLAGVDEALHQELHELERRGHAHNDVHNDNHGHDAGHGAHGHSHHHGVKSEIMPESAVYVLEKMAHGFRRMGRAQGAGFYDYLDGEAPELWDGLSVFARGANKADPADIADRLLYIQAIESMRSVELAQVDSVARANETSMNAWGFPASTGGSIAVVNSIGLAAFCTRATDLAGRYGQRFAPPALLTSHAESNQAIV